MELQLFRRFTQRIEIDEISKILQSENIIFKISSPVSHLGSSFGDAKQEFFELYIAEKDFDSVKLVLEKRAEEIAQTITTDYYLYSFSNDELQDVLNHPEDWNEIDVVLSKTILKERKISTEIPKKKIADSSADKQINKTALSNIEDSRWKSVKRYILPVISILIGALFTLYVKVYQPDMKDDHIVAVIAVLIVINLIFLEPKRKCPKCKEKHSTELIVKLEQGDRLMPRPYNVLEKFKCNNCGYRWHVFSEERIGD